MKKMKMADIDVNQNSNMNSLDAVFSRAHKSRSIYLMRLCSILLPAIKLPTVPKMNVAISADYKCNTHNIAAMLR